MVFIFGAPVFCACDRSIMLSGSISRDARDGRIRKETVETHPLPIEAFRSRQRARKDGYELGSKRRAPPVEHSDLPLTPRRTVRRALARIVALSRASASTRLLSPRPEWLAFSYQKQLRRASSGPHLSLHAKHGISS
ncbi:hypothetical protein IE81DRAFT_217548 [Ceraceosorus guamensis]|uniref:Uncharacterized protein n=1 Tax=Ceraceosorus guamensis TaxID=1522189 RepID=A0A316VUL1_9BASI|nr:hypothetical protein IE81DRAFT_217548 [Ceraceosorus guamensis]PWN40578.1 hypothetical protein IE81DRAFT_217548 [Ceraceosorus guamensis]